jgi:DNA-binding transcriptional regulator YdaS (Cro superfamily)
MKIRLFALPNGPTPMSERLELALRLAGGAKELAQALGVTPQAVAAWRRVPGPRVLAVERLTGVPRELLREDLYPIRPLSHARGEGTGRLP